MHNLASQPERATTSFTLSHGLLNVVVSVYTGTEEVRVVRKEFTTDGDPVGRVSINKTTGAVLDRSDVIRMAESTNGVMVPLTDEEIENATQVKGLGTIETFIPVKALSQYTTEGLMQVRPKRVKGKMDPAGVKVFALLVDIMKVRKVVALVKVALRGPARYALLDQDGYMRWVVTADAVRQPIDMPTAPLSKAEKDMGLLFLDSVGITTPTLTDDTAAAVQSFVDAKAAGSTPVAKAAPTATTDLYQALQASINKDVKAS